MNGQIICYSTTLQKGPWRITIHHPHGNESHHRKHVHIRRDGLNGEYSWNIDGTRHDKYRFPPTEQQINAAKQLAADALGIPKHSLQLITSIGDRSRVAVSTIVHSGRAQSIFAIYVRVNDFMIVIGSTNGLIVFILDSQMREKG